MLTYEEAFAKLASQPDDQITLGFLETLANEISVTDFQTSVNLSAITYKRTA